VRASAWDALGGIATGRIRNPAPFASASSGARCLASRSSSRIELSSGVFILARIRGATVAADRETTGDCAAAWGCCTGLRVSSFAGFVAPSLRPAACLLPSRPSRRAHGTVRARFFPRDRERTRTTLVIDCLSVGLLPGNNGPDPAARLRNIAFAAVSGGCDSERGSGLIPDKGQFR
jgi:hypothetical protein